MNTAWIITSEINQYDQEGEYFQGWFSKKPTEEQLINMGFTKKFIPHLLNGGGRIDVENVWYWLKEIKEGEVVIYE